MSNSRDSISLDFGALTALKKKKEALAAAKAETAGQKTSELSGATVTISRPRHEVFASWRDFEKLPAFFDNLERVTLIDSKSSQWVFKAPGDTSVELEVMITEESEDELIVWRAAEDAKVQHSGRVEFHDAGDRGTIVAALITYDPPGGGPGELLAKLFQHDPETQTRRNLRRFKQLMETGEVATAARTRAERAEEKG
jgi:uncharacterized membrane protein